MTLAAIILIGVGLLIYFGFAQRVLDHLYLSDTMALIVIGVIIITSFFELTIVREPLISLNIGGALIPILLVIYILSKIDTKKEWLRTIVAVILTAGAIYAITIIFRDFGHGRDIIDPMYLYAISGGLIAYILGRSRRAAFIAGTLGFIIYDLINVYRVLRGQFIGQVRIGGAGAFDSIVIAGLFAVLLAEVIGETRERLAGGHKERSDEDE